MAEPCVAKPQGSSRSHPDEWHRGRPDTPRGRRVIVVAAQAGAGSVRRRVESTMGHAEDEEHGSGRA